MVELYGAAKDWDSLEGCFSKYSAIPDCRPLYRSSSPLMTAAKENNREFAERLLTHGANVNKTDSSGLRPLNYALRAGHVSMATFLLEKGADSAYVLGAKKRDQPPVTLLDDAKQGGITDAELLKKLAAGVPLTEEAEHAALLVAVEMNNMDLVNQLLERGALFASGEKYYVGKMNDIKARQMHAFLEEKGVRVDYSD
ncbi:ankyrin repeat domain-containing protein [Desulfovibrio sp. OttesenSCG-928-G15]|nr:ankyrin repeat domain-containing protein [Desulfovibrio sp. OttesenSCG-928-G15]